MRVISKFFKRKKVLCQDDMVRVYCHRAKQAILVEDLPKAIAHLSRGIELAPNQLKLYLQRAQIFQYGLLEYSTALRDYHHILRELESRPDPTLADQCKRAMRDMMYDDSHKSVQDSQAPGPSFR